jgi:hypothetical protein
MDKIPRASLIILLKVLTLFCSLICYLCNLRLSFAFIYLSFSYAFPPDDGGEEHYFVASA